MDNTVTTPHVVSLIMYPASYNNQVIMTSTSSTALYISANHIPLLGALIVYISMHTW